MVLCIQTFKVIPVHGQNLKTTELLKERSEVLQSDATTEPASFWDNCQNCSCSWKIADVKRVLTCWVSGHSINIALVFLL